MVRTYNGEMYVIPKAFEEEIRAEERAKCKCPYWNEEHQECATSFEEDIRADERNKVVAKIRVGLGKIKTFTIETRTEYREISYYDAKKVLELLNDILNES